MGAYRQIITWKPSADNVMSNHEPAQSGKGEQLKKRLVFFLTLLLIIGITAALFIYRGKVTELGNYGYLGAFLISLVSSATILLPLPGFLVVFPLGAALNPILVGLAAAGGATIGEMTGYLLGFTGRGIVEKDRA